MPSTSPRRTALVLAVAAACWLTGTAAIATAAEWVAPLSGPLVVTRAFDPPATAYGPGHRGVDLAGQAGEPVRSAGAGTVVYAGPLAGRGVVSVQHADDLRTTYEPVSASVSAGMAVAMGQVVGSLQAGHDGCPVAACLHWGLRRGEVYLDPLTLLTAGPVRLLPRYGGDADSLALAPTTAVTTGSVVVGALGLAVARGRTRGLRPDRPVRRIAGSSVTRGDGPADRPP